MMSIDHQSPIASSGRATGHFAPLWLVRLTMLVLPPVLDSDPHRSLGSSSARSRLLSFMVVANKN
jgi:hypothetical protein